MSLASGGKRLPDGQLFPAGESACEAWHKLLHSKQESEELLFTPKGTKSSHQSCSSHISGLCVCFMGKQSQIALSFISWPRKGVRQWCHCGGCRTRDVSHHGRNLEPLLLSWLRRWWPWQACQRLGSEWRDLLSAPCIFPCKSITHSWRLLFVSKQHSAVCLQGWSKWKTPLSFLYDLLAYV